MIRKLSIIGLLQISGNIYSNFNKIKRLNKLNDSELKKYQEKKLKKLLIHSYKNVAYYRKILKKYKVVDKNLNVNLQRFFNLPFLTKDIIRNNFEDLKSTDLNSRKWKFNTSGGSTGEPVRFIQDKDYEEWNIANKLFYKTFANQNLGDRELRFWGSERDILEEKEKLSIRLRNYLYNRREFNTFKMSKQDMKRFVKDWNDFKPQWVEAYVQSIYEFAKFVQENKLSVSTPRGILTSAGTLYPEMEELISKVFKCRVYNRYGSREVGDIACSDNSSKGLMISVWNQYVEVIDGKIYVTNLNNYAMPLIRYEIGDVGEKGNNWRYLKKIEGREMSMLKTKEGRLIPGEFFIHFIGVVHNKGIIDKFQVIQKDYDEIVIKVIIKDKTLFEKEKNKIEKSIQKVMQNNCKIMWEEVSEIETLKSGKYLYVISEIK